MIMICCILFYVFILITSVENISNFICGFLFQGVFPKEICRSSVRHYSCVGGKFLEYLDSGGGGKIHFPQVVFIKREKKNCFKYFSFFSFVTLCLSLCHTSAAKIFQNTPYDINFVCILKSSAYLFERQNDKQTDGGVGDCCIYWLIPPNACSSQDWAKLKTGARDTILEPLLLPPTCRRLDQKWRSRTCTGTLIWVADVTNGNV